MSDLPPVVALRTYSAIRLGVVAVIGALGVAVAKQIASAPDHCVQRSLSAYYYTPVRPVFVGALLIIGFAMISMWGKTPWEDAALNVAGLLITVVALVPTLDAYYCSLPKDVRDKVPDEATQEQLNAALIRANAPEVHSNFFTLLITLAAILGVVALVGGWLYFRAPRARRPSAAALVAYGITWALAATALVVYLVLYQDADDVDSFFNNHVHSWSANIGFACIILAVAFAALEKGRTADSDRPWWTRLWVWLYGLLALAMVLAAAVIRLREDHFTGWYAQHSTFLLEAILISLLAVFWVLQTIDRWDEGAPSY